MQFNIYVQLILHDRVLIVFEPNQRFINQPRRIEESEVIPNKSALDYREICIEIREKVECKIRKTPE